MRRSKFTEAQIIGFLQELEAGANKEELARRIGLSVATLARWKAKYGGMEVSEAQEKRRLEDENRKLRQLVTDQALDIVALKSVLGKKW